MLAITSMLPLAAVIAIVIMGIATRATATSSNDVGNNLFASFVINIISLMSLYYF